MIDPALHTRRQLHQRDFIGDISSNLAAQMLSEIYPFAPFEATPLGRDDEAEKRNAFRDGSGRAARMDYQSQLRQSLFDLGFPCL